jgi:hypothetical protein
MRKTTSIAKMLRGKHNLRMLGGRNRATGEQLLSTMNNS